MSVYNLCPHCKQPMPSQKTAGVYMPARKAQIFKVIERHPGIDAAGIIQKIYQGRGNPSMVRSHVYQINELLEETEVRIRIVGHGSYRVERP